MKKFENLSTKPESDKKQNLEKISIFSTEKKMRKLQKGIRGRDTFIFGGITRIVHKT